MNTTFKEIIYNLKNLKQAGRQSQDQLLQDAQYAFIVDYYRAILISRDYQDKKALSPVFEQTIKVPFVRATNLENNILFDRKVYIANPKIPSVVTTNTRPLYSAVRKNMLSRTLDRSTTLSIRHDLNSPTTGNLPRYFPEEQDLYIVTPSPLESMFVTAVFEHPLEVEVFKHDLGQTNKYDLYDPYNFEYPISLKQLDTIYKMMIQGEINLSLVTPNDIKADGNEERGGQVPKSSRQDES